MPPVAPNGNVHCSQSTDGTVRRDPPAHGPGPHAGGTTFTFITGGIESALAHAREALGERDLDVAGGAEVLQQFLPAGMLDEFEVSPPVRS
jgi:dihydrofolate reductase